MKTSRTLPTLHGIPTPLCFRQQSVKRKYDVISVMSTKSH